MLIWFEFMEQLMGVVLLIFETLGLVEICRSLLEYMFDFECVWFILFLNFLLMRADVFIC